MANHFDLLPNDLKIHIQDIAYKMVRDEFFSNMQTELREKAYCIHRINARNYLDEKSRKYRIYQDAEVEMEECYLRYDYYVGEGIHDDRDGTMASELQEYRCRYIMAKIEHERAELVATEACRFMRDEGILFWA